MNSPRNKLCLAFALLTGMAVSRCRGPTAFADEPTAQELEFFEQQVRPLLVKRCYECHSSETSDPEGGLRLDSRDGWETGGDSGTAIEAGNVEGSLLITAIRYDGLEMPPEGKLPPEEIAILERWVAIGAPDPRTSPAKATRAKIDFEMARQYWAFQRPHRHEPPGVAQSDWPTDEIDRFVLVKIEQAGLTPSVEADDRTWLRRVTFDLTGLPPSPEEIKGFLADSVPDAAKARVVDRLLNSSAFGEHWGRHWLDVARYADTNGGDFNATFKSAWRYRDYVIEAFNADKPYDNFVREQLAGDLLPFADDQQRAEQLIATGFLMIGCKMLSERDKAKFRMDVVDEQVDTVGRAFLGLTLGCARCHDHKFDPLPTADYYALAGIFQSTETYRGESQKYVSTWKEVDLPVAPVIEEEVERYKQRGDQLQAAIKDIETQQRKLSSRLQALDPELEGIVVDDTQAKQTGTWKHSTYSPRYFGKGYIHNDKQGLGEKSVTYVPAIPTAGRYEVRMSFAGSGGRATNVPVVVKCTDGEERLTVDQTRRPPIDDLWLPLGTFEFSEGDTGSVTIRTEDTNGYVLADAVQFLPLAETANVVASVEPGVERQIARLRQEVSEIDVRLREAREQLKAHEAAAPPPVPTCMAVREHTQIGDAAIRIRGDVHREGDIIPRGFLTVLAENDRPQLSDTSQSGRLELADWIASTENPLTARVMVNRVWQHLFGRGIVPSVDNFGQLGQSSTHPELLDTLAVDLMEDGWSVKRLIRRIVLSRTYGLSSLPPADTGDDPENDLLTHARRRRLPAEALRDAMLAISGQLDREAGGSSVEPLEYLAIATSGKKSADLQVDGNRRRSVYLPMVRNDLPEFLQLFDVADPELVTGRRPVTNVPAQALYLMNSQFVARAAEHLATDLLSDLTADPERLIRVYNLLYTRVPTQQEQERALEFLGEVQGEPEAQAWTRLIQVLLASTEFRMLD